MIGAIMLIKSIVSIISISILTFFCDGKLDLRFLHKYSWVDKYALPCHDIKLHPHRVKLYRVGCVGSGLVLAKALT